MQCDSRLQQICGPEIEGREECPPVYHVDFTQEEFQELIANPSEVLSSLGYQNDVQPTVVFQTSQAWSRPLQEWTKPDLSMKCDICCFVYGGQIICGCNVLA